MVHFAEARETKGKNDEQTRKEEQANNGQKQTKEGEERGEKRRAYPVVFRGRRESAGSVYLCNSTQFSPANSAESERSLSASLHSVTGECNWRKSNPYWHRWPRPDYIWRTDGTCSLLSGGIEIAVWVTKEQRISNCGPKPVKAGIWSRLHDNTQRNGQAATPKQTTHQRTANKNKQTTNKQRQTDKHK